MLAQSVIFPYGLIWNEILYSVKYVGMCLMIFPLRNGCAAVMKKIFQLIKMIKMTLRLQHETFNESPYKLQFNEMYTLSALFIPALIGLYFWAGGVNRAKIMHFLPKSGVIFGAFFSI